MSRWRSVTSCDADDARRIARPRRRNRAVERRARRVAQRDAAAVAVESDGAGLNPIVRGRPSVSCRPASNREYSSRNVSVSNRLHAIEEQHAVEVIVLVLRDAGRKFVERQLDARCLRGRARAP